jgi:hypothetical protein
MSSVSGEAKHSEQLADMGSNSPPIDEPTKFVSQSVAGSASGGGDMSPQVQSSEMLSPRLLSAISPRMSMNRGLTASFDASRSRAGSVRRSIPIGGASSASSGSNVARTAANVSKHTVPSVWDVYSRVQNCEVDTTLGDAFLAWHTTGNRMLCVLTPPPSITNAHALLEWTVRLARPLLFGPRPIVVTAGAALDTSGSHPANLDGQIPGAVELSDLCSMEKRPALVLASSNGALINGGDIDAWIKAIATAVDDFWEARSPSPILYTVRPMLWTLCVATSLLCISSVARMCRCGCELFRC